MPLQETATLTNPFKVIKPCGHCKKDFVSYTKENRTFCSKECFGHSKKGIPFVEKTGKEVNCHQCNKKIYKPLCNLERSENHFCSPECANDYQKRNKINFTCKTCNSPFQKSPSEITKAEERNHNILYCSIECRNNDSKRMSQKSYEANQARLEKYGLNKFEIEGREFLQSLGFKLNEDFQEQVLLLESISVDVVFPEKMVVVQFDGDYWHSNPLRSTIDQKQDAKLKEAGYHVFRINDKITKDKGFNVYYSDLLNLLN